ncbi:MAG: hypothetical protein FWC60_03050 [Firmicutes bacterium]|nr:hypothetical protein [Bacillota bacterium]
MLVLIAQARKTINRKRFLEEYKRTVNSFACRSMLNSNLCTVTKKRCVNLILIMRYYPDGDD